MSSIGMTGIVNSSRPGAQGAMGSRNGLSTRAFNGGNVQFLSVRYHD